MSPKVSALLHPTTGFNQALDMFSNEETTATVANTNAFGKFMYVDIPVEYDPCTCGTEATLVLQYSNVITQNIGLAGRFWALDRTLAEINDSKIDLFDENYLLNVLASSSPGEVLGTQTFADMNRLVKFHEELKEENDALKAKYERAKAFQDIIKLVGDVAGPLAAVPSGLLGSITLLDSLTVLGVTGVDYSGKDLVSGMMSGFNYYSSRLKKQLDSSTGKLNRVGGSSVSHGEMAFSGNISTSLPLGGEPKWRLPGSATAADLCNYPVGSQQYIASYNNYPRYNEILGRFAVLETPRAEVYLGTGYSWSQTVVNFDASSLQYVYNPAAGISAEGTDIWAALEITIADYVHTGFKNMKLVHSSDDGSLLTYQTPVMPLACLGEYAAALSSSSLLSNMIPSSIVLKLFVEFEFEGGGKSLQVYSYPVSPTFINFDLDAAVPLITPTPVSGDDILLTTTHFLTDELIFAWNSITIIGDLTADPGVKVEILAPDIRVLNQSFIGSDIWLRNGSAPYDCSPIEEYTGSLSAFCSSSKYKASQSSSLLQSSEEAFAGSGLGALEAPVRLDLHAQVYPNPTSGQATLSLHLPQGGPVSAQLSDMQGRLLQEVLPPASLPAGEHLFELPTAGLPPGMYLITVRTPEGPVAVRLAKQ